MSVIENKSNYLLSSKDDYNRRNAARENAKAEKEPIPKKDLAGGSYKTDQSQETRQETGQSKDEFLKDRPWKDLFNRLDLW